MTPAHSGIHFGRIGRPVFRRRLAAVTVAATTALGIATLMIAPASTPACHSLARATQAPDLRITVLPGVDLEPVLALPGLSAASGPYPGVATSVQAGGTEISTWIEGRPGQASAVDRPFLVHGSWTRPNGMVVDQGLARRLGLRVGRRARVASAHGSLSLRVTGIAATSSVARTATSSGLAYVRLRDLRRIAPARVHGSTLLLQGGGRDPGPLASRLARRYPGPQAVIARGFGDRCIPQ